LFRALPKLALQAQPVGIAYLSLRQDLLAKNVSRTAQSDFSLSNSPLNYGLTLFALWLNRLG